MAWIRTEALRAGAVLSRPLVDSTGRVVVPSGTALSDAEVALVRRSSLTDVEVVDDPARAGMEAQVRRAYRNNDPQNPVVGRLAALSLRRRLSRGTGGGRAA